ncbi:DUF1885 family protein [Bacillus sp. REN16]|uniref:DUF1885 family protein n=1 Tax=Bacillus sp. REN16 TaxID=2887296 RepID=UPI001E5D502B|nr:DUF1885 family protein [Bacillus sp. REN16]MCC3357630.1 DUF1885 family protein [Bacillus sp. REN16]
MENAYIKLVSKSNIQNISLDDVKDLFNYYKEITGKTGKQLDWDYNNAAFPYQIKEINHEKNWFYLKSDQQKYNAIVIGVGHEKIEDEIDEIKEQTYIQVTLPESSTPGDKGKANEFCKFLAKKLEGELHLFNERVMYFYKRK